MSILRESWERRFRWAIGLIGIASLSGIQMTAEASCFVPRAITSWSANAASYLYTPGWPFAPRCSTRGAAPSDGLYSCGGTMSYYAIGFFWAWGGGSPITPGGVDCGFNAGKYGSNWLQLTYFPYSAFIGGPASHWNTPGTDGCITQTGSNFHQPDSSECLVVLLNDVDGPNSFFLAMSVRPDPFFDFQFNTTTGFPPRLKLVRVPRPRIESAAALGGGTVQLQVSLPVGSLTRTNGFDFKCHGAPGEILTGFKLYARSYPASGPEPLSGESRAVGPMPAPVPNAPAVTPWQLVSGPSPVPLGTEVSVEVPCSDTENVVLCATLTFGGPSNLQVPGNPDWELLYCSHSSAPISCGTTFANPGQKNEVRHPDRLPGPVSLEGPRRR